jgi:hypothetical protein
MKNKPAGKQQSVRSNVETPANERVQQRAYELFLQRGQQPGHELEDWLQAEREVMHTGNGASLRRT